MEYPIQRVEEPGKHGVQRVLHSKRETPSGVTSTLAPTAPLEREGTLGKGAVRKLSPGR